VARKIKDLRMSSGKSNTCTIRESNPGQMLGRHLCYHYTNGAPLCLKLISNYSLCVLIFILHYEAYFRRFTLLVFCRVAKGKLSF
jgi:hypothetical protein